VPVKVAIVFVLATIGFYVAIEAGWFTYAEYANPADREGGVGMDVVFIIGPICALILGAGAAFLFGGKEAPHKVKVAAGLIGLLILAALLGSVLGF
jgi:Mg/Co/Ni transporter MgtE